MTTTKSANKNVLEAGEQLKTELYDNPVLSRARLLVVLNTHLPNDYSEEERVGVVTQLESLGYLVRAKKDGRDYCLNPTWTIDHAYQFLHLDCVQQNNKRNKQSQNWGVVNIDIFESEASPLDDVQVLISGGMGTGLVRRLENKGIKPLITSETDPDKAIDEYLKGTLITIPAEPHEHSHKHAR